MGQLLILGLAAVCLAFAVGGARLGGAGSFPVLVGVLGAGTAAVCLFLQRSRGSPGGQKPGGEKKDGLGRGTLVTLALSCLYPLLVAVFGYIVGTIIFSSLAVMGLERNKWKTSLGFAALVVGLWWVFSGMLQLRLPPGAIWLLLE